MAADDSTPTSPLVLCVDDTPNILSLVRTVLTKAGFQVLTARSGLEALDVLGRTRPDAVLLDIAMPVMGGLDTLARMAADPALAAIPVMMLTSNSQERNVRAALALGARDFVVKPFTPDHLVQRVQRLLAPAPAAAPTEPAAAAEAPAAGELDVLVATAEPGLRAAVAEALDGAFSIAAAATAAAAIELASRRRPRVVFLDLQLPVPQEAETARRLGQSPTLAIQRLALRLRVFAGRVIAIRVGDPREESQLAAFDGAVERPPGSASLRRYLP